MKDKKIKPSVLNKTKITIAGILLLLISAVALLWYGNVNSMQAIPALVAQVDCRNIG